MTELMQLCCIITDRREVFLAALDWCRVTYDRDLPETKLFDSAGNLSAWHFVISRLRHRVVHCPSHTRIALVFYLAEILETHVDEAALASPERSSVAALDPFIITPDGFYPQFGARVAKTWDVGKALKIGNRAVLNGIWYVLWIGCQWKAVHRDWFGASSSVLHERFQTWQEQGIWDAVFGALVQFYRRERHIQWHWQAVDNRSCAAPLDA